MKYAAIGLAGAAGAILRYATGIAAEGAGSFPAGTWLANMAGCFLLAFLTAGVFHLDKFPKDLAAPISTGLIGSYTTFSAFSLEMVLLMEQGRFQKALFYFLASAVPGLFLSIGGWIAGTGLIKRRKPS
ncbi:fluoride efflux transporter CrcB [Bacillus mangrovi]|uniref:Fluoride-specific ion channel FluC n=1 Tax=Metabacillus mangrovi TaxID=1491830 RepID=A0A7X2V6Q9_9BACI|nr:CrcB family protein [Metabacillus mangrovi]MTH55680.1 fluoride efflux transporter CrcB [Metabacillus mangrovi]